MVFHFAIIVSVMLFIPADQLFHCILKCEMNVPSPQLLKAEVVVANYLVLESQFSNGHARYCSRVVNSFLWYYIVFCKLDNESLTNKCLLLPLCLEFFGQHRRNATHWTKKTNFNQ